MVSSMKRYVPYALFIGGLLVLCTLMPRFNTAQPRGAHLTRAQAMAIADAAARQINVPVDRAWSNIIWDSSDPLIKEFENDPQRRKRAAADPTLGPRLGYYDIAYFRRGSEKSTPYGRVKVSANTGEVLGARHPMTMEERGASATEQTLRPRADAFVHSRIFPGAPWPKFEQARPTVQRNRTDWVFRYRVATAVPAGNVVPYLNVYFNGDQFGG